MASVDLGQVASLTGRLCDALAAAAAAAAAATGPGLEADVVAEELDSLLQPLGRWDDEPVAAAAGVLVQAYEATAALIGSALLALDDDALHDARQVVTRTLGSDAPVRCTRRVAVADVMLGDALIPAGATVWLMLDTMQRDSAAPPPTFGSHGCPGASLAFAVAVGVLRQVQAAGWRPVPGQVVDYEPRPNLRLPRRVMVEQR